MPMYLHTGRTDRACRQPQSMPMYLHTGRTDRACRQPQSMPMYLHTGRTDRACRQPQSMPMYLHIGRTDRACRQPMYKVCLCTYTLVELTAQSMPMYLHTGRTDRACRQPQSMPMYLHTGRTDRACRQPQSMPMYLHTGRTDRACRQPQSGVHPPANWHWSNCPRETDSSSPVTHPSERRGESNVKWYIKYASLKHNYGATKKTRTHGRHRLLGLESVFIISYSFQYYYNTVILSSSTSQH